LRLNSICRIKDGEAGRARQETVEIVDCQRAPPQRIHGEVDAG